jgi:predicted pyridoxine 5'-phosphate oxidase superfamily flavin-nucleotide-binding protein
MSAALVTLDDDMRAVLAAQRLCFAATVTPDGKPNLSPKGTIRAWDAQHLYFCDIASPGTRGNLASNPWIELNVVDGVSRRGYRFYGRATVHVGDEVHRAAAARIAGEEGHEYPVQSVVLVALERAAPLVSPGYQFVKDEWEMREAWKGRRAQLDEEFESHAAPRRPSRLPPASEAP